MQHQQKVIRRYELPFKVLEMQHPAEGDQKVRASSYKCGRCGTSTGAQLARPWGVLNSLRQSVLKALITEEKTILCNYMRRWIFTNCGGNDFMIYVSLHTLNSALHISQISIQLKEKKIQWKPAKDMNRCFTKKDKWLKAGERMASIIIHQRNVD